MHGGMSGEGAAICCLQTSEAAHGFRCTRNSSANWGNCSAPTALGFFDTLRGGALRGIAQRCNWLREIDSALRIPCFLKAPSVEVHGGIRGEGAAICGIPASEAADEFSGTRISYGELGELQRPYFFKM